MHVLRETSAFILHSVSDCRQKLKSKQEIRDENTPE